MPEPWAPLIQQALTISLPPLRERLEDLALLLAHLTPNVTWSQGAQALLAAYDWPGNVAELKRVAEQAVHLAGEGPVQPEHLPSHFHATDAVVPGRFILPQEGIDLEEVEQDLIRQALAMARGNKTQAARLLGLSRATLLYRLDKYGITGEDT